MIVSIYCFDLVKLKQGNENPTMFINKNKYDIYHTNNVKCPQIVPLKN